MAGNQSQPTKAVFSSRRERHLWIWVLLVTAAIFASLILGSLITGLFSNQAFSTVAFLTGIVLIAVAILTGSLKYRPAGLDISVGLGVAVVYLMMPVRMTLPERSHLFEYGMLAVFVLEALTERRQQGRQVPVPVLLSIFVASVIGVLDEVIQILIPARVFDVRDILFNFLAAVIAVSAVVALRWARGLQKRRASRNV